MLGKFGQTSSVVIAVDHMINNVSCVPLQCSKMSSIGSKIIICSKHSIVWENVSIWDIKSRVLIKENTKQENLEYRYLSANIRHELQ